MTLSVMIAQGLGFLGLASNMASVQSRRRIWVLIFQIFANLLYGVQYIFLNAWSAMAVCAISAIECVIVYYYDVRANPVEPTKVPPCQGRSDGEAAPTQVPPCQGRADGEAIGRVKPNTPLPVLVVIVFATVVAGLISFDGDLFSAIPIIVTVAYTLAVWQPNLRLFRLTSALISAGWFIYNWHVAAYVSMATAVVEFTSAVVAIVRLDILPKRRHRYIDTSARN